MSELPLILGLVAGIVAAAYAGTLIARINKLPAGNEKMQSIAAAMAVIINIICKTDDRAILFFICSPLFYQYNMAESVLQ